MPTTIIRFPTPEVSEPAVKSWFTNNLPDYSQKLQTKEDAYEFDSEPDINKVYLFTGKTSVPPIYQALTQNF